MVSVEVDLKTTPKVLTALSKIVKNQKSYGMFRSIARLLFHSWWSQTFLKGGARRGHVKWRPLKPEYAAWKIRRGLSRATLQFTGHLLGSPNIIEERKTSLVWGTRIPYAKYHQAPTVPGHPPKREIIFITKQDRDELGAFTVRFIERVMKGASRG